MRVVVVGGGITGLSAAWFLVREAKARGLDLEVVGLEAGPRLGGKVWTEEDPPFRMEAGPDGFLAFGGEVQALCRDLGLEGQWVAPRPGPTYLLHRGRLVPLPEGLLGGVPSRLPAVLASPLLSWRGKVRLALEPLVPPRRDGGDESLGAFLRRRLGREAAERLVGPLLAGAYAGNPDTLSLAATFPFLREAEARHGSLLRWARASTRGRQDGPPRFLSLRAGMGTLPKTLATALASEGVGWHTRCPVRRLEVRNGRYRLETPLGPLEADRVLMAVPAYEAARLLEPLAPAAAEVLGGIPYVDTAVVGLAFPRAGVEHPLEGSGFVVPPAEGRALTACTWLSSKWPERAPAEAVLVRAFFGRHGQEEPARLPGEDLVDLAMEELKGVLGLTSPPIRTWVHRWPRGLPHYPVGHLDRLARAEAVLREACPGLVLAGAGYRGAGVPACIRQAGEAARRLLE